MKSKWIRKAGNSRLILFFGGFACDERLLSRSYIPEDVDVLMFFDYRNLDFNFDFGEYSNIGVVAWSFGVWVADYFAKDIPNVFMRIAINGTQFPVDEKRGILPEIFEKTVAGFDEKVKNKFFRRICGGSNESGAMASLLSNRSAAELKEELEFLQKSFKQFAIPKVSWTGATCSKDDKIFPIENAKKAWGDSLRVCDGEHLNPSIFGVVFSRISMFVDKLGSVFEKHLNSYVEEGFVQREISETLSDSFSNMKISKPEISTILEVGCGSGFLTKFLSPKYKNVKWYLNDLSRKMCESAAKSCLGAPIVCPGDIMSLELDEKVDLVLSSSCFQWIENLPALFEKLYTMSNPEAGLVFSTFGNKNFFQIREILKKGLKYFTVREICSMLETANYRVLYTSEEVINVPFKSPKDILKHIKSTGVNGRFAEFWTPSKFKRFNKEYIEKFSVINSVDLTYNPIYIIAQKKS